MSHPFILRMQAAIIENEKRFFARLGLPSPALVQEVKERLATHTMREALKSEPEVLPPHRRRGTWKLASGEIVDFPKDKHGRTRFMRGDYDAADVAYLQRVVEAQPKTFTFEQTMSLKSKCKVDRAEIARVRKGI